MAMCSEVSSLRSAEEGVVGCLEAADLRRFLDDSCALGAVPQGVKKDLASLDPEAVPRSLMVRYLLLHVYEWLEANPRLYQRWLKVLGRYVSEELLCKVRQGYAMLVSPKVSAETMCLADGIEEGFKCGVQGGVNFRERHVSILTEILVGWSVKWYQIGLSLNLPHNYLDQLRTLLVIHGCEVCLSKVLHEWIVGQNEYAKPPTVESLKQALRSGLVGLGDVANQLDDQLSKHGISLNDEEPLPKRPRLAAPPVEIVSQSRDITVVEGKSTLLEVQVETRDQTNISYQWLKDGLPLEEGGEFSGVTRPILHLHSTSLTSGTYICAVRFHDGADSVSSEPIVVQISLQPLKKILVDRYCSQPTIPTGSWPPQSSNTCINLALIKEGSINDAGEYARNTIQGNLDDDMNDKESVEYEAVFSDLKSGTRLLIEGRPGSGKSTLVHKFSRDWGRGGIELRLDSMRLLFLVHLRAFSNDPDITLRKIVQCYYTQGSTYVDDVLRFAEDHCGEGLCFILDGLDEYSPRSEDNTFVFKLIKRELLPKAVVIVASRPAATAKLRRIATKRVEVLGFLKEQIYQYMLGENYEFSNSKRADLRKYLDEHPNIRHMCYLPIHCAMVCFLFDIMGSCLPHTETEMYTEFTKHTLLRTLTRSGVDSLNSPEDLPSNEKNIFHQICKLGFEKTIASKQVMKKSELDFFMDLTSGSELLGLITVDRMASKCGFDNLYSFLHLTFQEYLAAYHISKLAEDEQLKLISKYGKSKCMYVVWKFFCGLVEFQENNVHIFDRILASKSKSLEGDLYSVQCAFESQQAITCDSVVKFGECGTLYFFGVKTPSDFEAIVYVLKNTAALVNTLVFDQCYFRAHETIFEGLKYSLELQTLKFSSSGFLARFGDNCARALADGLKHWPDLRTLNLGDNSICYDGAKALADGLKHCPNLQTLNFSSNCSTILSTFGLRNKIGGDGARALADGLKHWPDLRTLNLRGNNIGDDGAGALGDGLKHCPNLQTLNLGNNCSNFFSPFVRWNRIGSDGAKALADGLKHCPNLQTLNIENNRIGDDGAKALADGLKHCPNLQTLNLELNRIGDDGAKALAGGLKHCPNLQTLDLEWNSISDDGSRAIASGLKHCPNLQTLNLRWNSIGDDGARALADCLKHCPNLQTLNLTRNRIGDDGARALADGLKHCPNLQTLNLEKNSIGDDGARALADDLKHCPNLQTLNLANNGIGDDGARALADGLKHWSSLQALKLWSNSIDHDCAKAIVDGLKHCPNLQTLDLGMCSIGDDGARALADGLKHCSNLQTLDLWSNNIGDDGARALADGLKHWSSLQALILLSNNIGDDGAKAIAVSLENCPNLQTLNLLRNSIGDDGARALADGLKHCPNLQTLNLEKNRIGDDGARALADALP